MTDGRTETGEGRQGERTGWPLRTRRAYPGMPGDRSIILLRAAEDVDGVRWRAGTVLVPLAGGATQGRYGGGIHEVYVEASIGGRRVIFAGVA